MNNKKYLVLLGALLAQLTIASLYAWSIFSVAFVSRMSWSENELIITYSIAQFVFAFTTLFSGRLVDSHGPKITLIIGGILFGGGLILSSLATTPFILYITYGLITGAGVGFVYVCPAATLIKWFPKRKGTIIGVSVAVFGGGSILFKEIITNLLHNYSIAQTFLVLGVLSAIVIIVGALFVKNPPNYQKDHTQIKEEDYSTKDMLKTRKFKKIWIMFFLAAIPGLLVLGAAKNIGLEANLTISAAASLISILALSNASSRIVSGALIDKIGAVTVLKAIYIITIISLVLMGLFIHNTVVFYIAIIGVAIGYGGFLTIFPTITNQQFGVYHYGSNYGLVFQAYGLAALAGIFIKSIVGSFTSTFIIAALAAIIGLAILFTMKEELPNQVSNDQDLI